ncbi:hypothetical protein [Enterobacillus tribolii]|uniref:Uncharacterized protein n=1 Tax=Enterobacillus tribolii TaxID=1487935 RepID=A0A370Q371_9GAMM|nr:hypothetical protein [Enterobacillus tribolii]MBW7982679.1 hypothetical protein [Enterobacillus tribolii]RDK82769.1 hypothetical protein C8D90_1272 [Enterobacillus tribolii]
MSVLNVNWKPEFGTIFTWFAMDKSENIAVMVNNCFGDLPKALLSINDVESLLDQLTHYMWEESEQFDFYPDNKRGSTILDLYSGLRFHHLPIRKDVEQLIKGRSSYDRSPRECNLPSRKGFFVYHGIEGDNPGQDYPVGYDGETKMGDYFRYLMPTVYASIEDFPKELRYGITVSNTADFTTDRIFFNDKINEYFPKMYGE